MKNAGMILFFAMLFCGIANAQEPARPVPSAVVRKELLKAVMDSEKSVASVEIKEVTIAPGYKIPLHLHPCPTVGLVTEGTIAFQIEGKPVQHLKAGDAFYEPADVRVARFDNEGGAPAKFVVFYLLGKDDKEVFRLLAK